jgi:hypothetical protein
VKLAKPSTYPTVSWLLTALVCVCECVGVGALAAEFSQAFGKALLDDQRLRMVGTDQPPIVRFDRSGMTVRLAKDRQSSAAVGVAFRSTVRGDFNITASFQVLQVEAPSPSRRAGVSLYLQTNTPTQEASSLWWIKRHTRKGVSDSLLCERVTTDDTGKRRHRNEQFKPEGSKLVKLRLVRKGSELKYLVAEGAKKTFRELHTEELGTEDVTFLRFAADRGDSPTALEVRFLELHIRADEFVEQAPVAVVEPSTNWGRWALWALFPVLAVAGWLPSSGCSSGRGRRDECGDSLREARRRAFLSAEREDYITRPSPLAGEGPRLPRSRLSGNGPLIAAGNAARPARRRGRGAAPRRRGARRVLDLLRQVQAERRGAPLRAVAGGRSTGRNRSVL